MSVTDDLSDAELMDVLGAEHREPHNRAVSPEGTRYDALHGANLSDLWERNQAPIDAVPTMLPKWNGVCGGKGGRQGLARGWNVLFAAPPGTMKSIFACNLAVNGAYEGEQVSFHSLEMDWDDNAIRTLAIASRTEVYRLEPGKGFDRVAARAATKVMGEIREKHGGTIWVNRDPVGTLSQLADAIRKGLEVRGSRFHIVDYLQLVGVGRGHWDDILARVTETSYVVRMLAKDLQVSIVGLSQLNRESIRQGQRPTSQDLMGGSPLENDAHQVLIYDPTRFKRDETGWRGWIAFVKNRHGDKGETADIPIHFDNRTLRIRERQSHECDGDEREQPARRRNG